MKSLLLDVKKGEISEVDPRGLDDFYRLIGCRTIDIVNLSVDGKRYDFVCDDEGLFVDDPKISALDYQGEPMLTGNLIIAGEARMGELTDLSEDDVRHLRSNIHKLSTGFHPEGLLMICQVDY